MLSGIFGLVIDDNYTKSAQMQTADGGGYSGGYVSPYYQSSYTYVPTYYQPPATQTQQTTQQTQQSVAPVQTVAQTIAPAIVTATPVNSQAVSGQQQAIQKQPSIFETILGIFSPEIAGKQTVQQTNTGNAVNTTEQPKDIFTSAREFYNQHPQAVLIGGALIGAYFLLKD